MYTAPIIPQPQPQPNIHPMNPPNNNLMVMLSHMQQQQQQQQAQQHFNHVRCKLMFYLKTEIMYVYVFSQLTLNIIFMLYHLLNP